MRLIILIFLVLFLFVIAACSKTQECEAISDCADKAGYSVDCDNDKCVYAKEVKVIKDDCSDCKEKTGYELVCDKSTGFSCEYKSIKSTVVVKQNNIFEERREASILFNLYYVFNNPFNVQNNTFDIKFMIKELPQNINSVRLDTIRLLEGQQEISSITPKKLLIPNKEIIIPIKLPPQSLEEVKRGITVGVWFDYNKDNKQNKHKFQKQIPERLTIITP